jgi:hypothetical protein
MTDPSIPQDIVKFQLAVLDAYQSLLDSCSWDEAKLNDVLKKVMSSFLPLWRAQHELGERLFASHKQLIRQYRQALEASLEQSGSAGQRRK